MTKRIFKNILLWTAFSHMMYFCTGLIVARKKTRVKIRPESLLVSDLSVLRAAPKEIAAVKITKDVSAKPIPKVIKDVSAKPVPKVIIASKEESQEKKIVQKTQNKKEEIIKEASEAITADANDDVNPYLSNTPFQDEVTRMVHYQVRMPSEGQKVDVFLSLNSNGEITKLDVKNATSDIVKYQIEIQIRELTFPCFFGEKSGKKDFSINFELKSKDQL